MGTKTNNNIGKYYYGEKASKPLPYNEISLANWFNFPCEYVFDWDRVGKDQARKNFSNLEIVKLANNRQAQIYIHIPYCQSYCYYCVFTREKFSQQDDEAFNSYIDYVCKELDTYLRTPYVQSMPITAITMGGGSPSTIPPKILEKLFKHLENVVPNYYKIEKTFTGEPRTLRNIETLKLLKNYGWTRITFGIETLNDEIKKQVGRLATNADVDAVFDGLRSIGFQGEINIDLMYNLPGQTFSGFQYELDLLVNHYCPDSLDAFPTIYMPFSKLYNMIVSGTKKQPACIWELLKMKEYLHDYLHANNYINLFGTVYANPKVPASHFHYGAYGREDVITVGVGAFGSIQGMSTVNPLDISTWMKNIDEYGVSTENIQPISEELLFIKTMVLFPRFNGIKKSLITQFSHLPWFDEVMKILKTQIEKQLVVETESEYLLTDLGLIWYTNLQADFVRHALNNKGKDLVKLFTYRADEFGNPNVIRQTDVLKNMVFR